MVRNGLPEDVARRAMDLFVTGGRVGAFAGNMALPDRLAGTLGGDPDALLGLEELRRIFEVLPSMGLDLDRFVIDITLARGLDY